MSNFPGINWNRVEDPVDKTVWDRLTTNFWVPEAVPVSNDLPSWRKMPEAEREVVRKVFVSLTTLDTLQGSLGAPTLLEMADTQHSEAVFSNISFMEHVHAKSYSTIFSTLCSTEEIDRLFHWATHDDLLQAQVAELRQWYDSGNDKGLAHAASVASESFLFYTGFYAPLRLAAEGKITNTADIIRLILRDEGVHGYYIGHCFQQIDPDLRVSDDAVISLIMRLYSIELLRAEQIYDEVGWTEDVKAFLRYNANKALANMGIAPVFDSKDTEIPSYILAALDPGTGESHDFFSGSGASYVIGEAEATEDEDWAW